MKYELLFSDSGFLLAKNLHIKGNNKRYRQMTVSLYPQAKFKSASKCKSWTVLKLEHSLSKYVQTISCNFKRIQSSRHGALL